MKLRPYQQKIVEELQARMRAGVRRLLVVAPTGSGKTVLAVRMLGGAVSKGMRALFIVHRRELVKQSVDAFNAGGVPCGTIAAGFPYESGLPVYVASIQTMIRRLHTVGDINLCIWDEAHHMGAKTWHKAYSYLHDSWHIGLTATPERLDGKGLARHFDEMVMGPSVHELIEQGSLSKYDYFAPDSNISLESIRTLAGDYAKNDLGDLMDSPTITNRAVDEYLRLADGKRFLAFAVNIKHSQNIVKEFVAKGIRAKHIDAETPSKLRDAAILGLSEGRLDVISNIGLFGEGVDLPALDGISILRPTKSLALHLQMCGRCLRPSPGKYKAIIIDHVKNLEEHGMPCDDRRGLWALEGRTKKEMMEREVTIQICEKCSLSVPTTVNVCPECGFVFKKIIRAKSEPLEVEGEIVKIDPAMARRTRLKEQQLAKDYESLVELGQRRGYKKPRRWAMHIMRARSAKKS